MCKTQEHQIPHCNCLFLGPPYLLTEGLLRAGTLSFLPLVLNRSRILGICCFGFPLEYTNDCKDQN